MRTGSAAAVAAAVAMVMAGASAEAATKRKVPVKKPVAIEVVSSRPDLVSGGDALLRVTLPPRASRLKLLAGTRDVTSSLRLDGRTATGLVDGLPVGLVRLKATARGARAGRLTIRNHPNGGPLFSGPQRLPWRCQAGAVDDQCNQPPSYTWAYRPASGGSLRPYDPAEPPGDVAVTTTDEGKRVPFIVRVETGYQNRDQYKIAVLFDPSKPFTSTAPQDGFNHKLLITHGFSCGIDHNAAEAPEVLGGGLAGDAPVVALGRGFAIASTALNNAGHNCNLVTQAESLVMVKERLVEQHGELRYTIGTGCSGGSLTQQQVANAYPGVYQGILPQCSFPDAWSTGNQLVDYHLTRRYLENPGKWGPGVLWDPLSIAAVDGHPVHLNSIILDTLYLTALGDPDNPCNGVTPQERWSAANPGGVRCTLADYMVNVMGRRPDGYAGRPLDNVGVQYGLEALRRGQITKAQFVDLNVKIGGADINTEPTPERTPADEPALRNAHRSGAINTASNLDQVAIIDLRGSDDGLFHDAYRAFAVRARLEREHGTFANHVIWRGPVPLLGELDATTQGLLAMDRWLAAVERDDRAVPLAAKIRERRPADVKDRCGLQSLDVGEDLCPLIVRTYATPRMVAGESVVTDTNKCRLKPLRRSDYVPFADFTDAEWAALQRTFPTGVCDFSQRGESAQDTVPWMTYEGAAHGRFGGEPLPVVPAPPGLAGPAFRAVGGTAELQRLTSPARKAKPVKRRAKRQKAGRRGGRARPGRAAPGRS